MYMYAIQLRRSRSWRLFLLAQIITVFRFNNKIFQRYSYTGLDSGVLHRYRRPGSSLGVMQYKIELSRACRVVEVTFIRETFENGEVAVNLSTGEDNSLCIRGNGLSIL